MNKQSYIFIGRSGCGKGAQVELLLNFLKKNDAGRGVFWVQTGAEFRRFIEGDSFTKRLSGKIYKEGKLQPEFLSVLMWANFMAENYNGNDHLLIDGTPRQVHEAGVLNSVFDFYGIKDLHVIYINTSEETAKKRLLGRGRMDDTEEDIKVRMEWFKTNVIPTVDFYKKSPQYNFVEVDGEGDPSTIHQDILKKVRLEL
ncbi:MAG: nucleoside monophosphate kinase [Candidatus Taylorbacteria bacterium]|nr:nucleoside monophosphate kinase [Candidatus Taylorbacteria bacterium]